MDGGTSDHDKLVVCAPRFSSPNDELLMHGICYWVRDTISNTPQRITKISPLRGINSQIKTRSVNGGNSNYYYYMLAEAGLSVHITDNSEDIIIGAPGVHTWKGSVIRYHPKQQDEGTSLSRRDTSALELQHARRQRRQNQAIKYISDVPNPENWYQSNDSYFGYAVSSGHFDSTDLSKVLYVASAPQAGETGEVS